MVLGRVLCLFRRHDPRRSRMHWSGKTYVSICRHCGKPLARGDGGHWHVHREDVAAAG